MKKIKKNRKIEEKKIAESKQTNIITSVRTSATGRVL